MRKLLLIVGFAAVAGGTAWSLWAQSGAAPGTAKTSPAQTQLDAKVAALAAMPPEARRAELKKLSAEERRGLWFQVMKTRAEQRGQTAKPERLQKPRTPIAPGSKRAIAPKGIGTIQYDSGAFSTTLNSGSIVGNRFDTHTGIPVLSPGTVSVVQAVVVPGAGNTTSSAGFVLLGPQTGGGGAMAIFSSFQAATGATDTVTFSGLMASYTGSFFVLFGDFANSYVPVFGTGTTNMQGHHGVAGITGGMGPNITATTNLGGTLNAFIRATGNIVPVELMTFEVE